MKPRVSLFIPVYNAGRYINKAIKQSYEILSQTCDTFEIVFVDDNSNDHAYRFLKVLERTQLPSEKMVRLIRNSNGPSRRENLGKAFTQSAYEIICFIDVDLSCAIAHLGQAINLLNEQGFDIVIGSRYIKGSQAKREMSRRIMSFFYNLTIRRLFGSKILDHQCGLKVFRKAAVTEILHDMGYDHHFIRGWFWDAEFLIRAQQRHLKILEIPVQWHFASTTTFNFIREWKCIAAMIQLKSDLDRDAATKKLSNAARLDDAQNIER